MAQQTTTAKKSHRERKNYRMAELHAKQRFERNASRGKQVWIGGRITDGGHWERIQS